MLDCGDYAPRYVRRLRVEEMAMKGILTSIPSSDMTVSWLESFCESRQHSVPTDQLPHVLVPSQQPPNINLIYAKHHQPHAFILNKQDDTNQPPKHAYLGSSRIHQETREKLTHGVDFSQVSPPRKMRTQTRLCTPRTHAAERAQHTRAR
jgi:hypothetical protein